jgi:hypothetical protein
MQGFYQVIWQLRSRGKCFLLRRDRDMLRSGFGRSLEKAMVGLEATLHYYWFGEEVERVSLTWYRGLQATSTDTPKLLRNLLA